jgi:excisionase family DNA binding protein
MLSVTTGRVRFSRSVLLQRQSLSASGPSVTLDENVSHHSLTPRINVNESNMSSESTAKNEPTYLTVAQLAQRLQVSESTIYGWVDRDYIPFLMAGDLVRFDPTAIHKWMSAEADRKREKKRGLRAARGKVAPAPGGCNRKGATG